MGTRGAGLVKAVLSGDTVIILGTSQGGAPPEKQISLIGILSPRLARKDAVDESFAWASRECLRSEIIGKQVNFVVEKIDPSSRRESGTVCWDGQNLAEIVVGRGLAKVQKNVEPRPGNYDELVRLEEAAQAQQIGVWSTDKSAIAASVRTVPAPFSADSAKAYVDVHKGKVVRGVIESFRDGACFRATLLPEFHSAMIMLSGLQAPAFKRGDAGEELAQPFARDSKFFVEARLLNREVDIHIEGCDKYGNLLGMVLHPMGNISPLLLKMGLAKLADWSFAFSTIQPQLRQAEAAAKEQHVRIWKDYIPKAAHVDVGEFTAKVIEVVSGDILVVQDSNGSEKRIGLSSIRVPKLGRRDDAPEPFALEAKEALRAKAIGKKVRVNVEYVRAIPNSEDRGFATVIVEGKTNLAMMLVEAGLATVVKHRLDEDRSSVYEQLEAAQVVATEKKKGQHSPNPPNVRAPNDLSGKDAKGKAATALPGLQRKGKMKAVCEYVMNGARLKVFIPKEATIITVSIAGVRCPMSSRAGSPGEPYGDEATQCTKDLCFQRDVEIEVLDMDRSGAFLSCVTVGKKDVSVLLLEEGLAWISNRSAVTAEHEGAEELSKKEEKRVWKGWEAKMKALEAERTEAISASDGTVSSKWHSVSISEVTDGVTVFVHKQEDKLEELAKLMEVFTEWASSQPANAEFSPKVGDVVGAMWEEAWCRVRIEGKVDEGLVEVQFIDYGNSDKLPLDSFREPLDGSGFPSTSTLPAVASECKLAYLKPPREEDEELCWESGYMLKELVWEKKVSMCVEYSLQKVEYVTLKVDDDVLTVNSKMLQEGLAVVDKKLARRHKKVEKQLLEDEKVARESRKKCFEYGEYDSDDDMTIRAKPAGK